MITEKSQHHILVRFVSRDQIKDSGMAYVLICLLLLIFTGAKIWLVIGVILLLINMTYSSFFYHPAILWLSFANFLGLVTSKVLLTLIYFLVISPVGLIRRMLGKLSSSKKSNKFDSMKISKWKQNSDSAFVTNNHEYTKKDLINPY
ncbi:MAG: hypothetical protein RO257_06300 [Candidatus Kapabacteria bacterium]|nr:hypothetical protein [Candidatus Kapabacteria bacterium]